MIFSRRMSGSALVTALLTIPAERESTRLLASGRAASKRSHDEHN